MQTPEAETFHEKIWLHQSSGSIVRRSRCTHTPLNQVDHYTQLLKAWCLELRVSFTRSCIASEIVTAKRMSIMTRAGYMHWARSCVLDIGSVKKSIAVSRISLSLGYHIQKVLKKDMSCFHVQTAVWDSGFFTPAVLCIKRKGYAVRVPAPLEMMRCRDSLIAIIIVGLGVLGFRLILL